MAMGSASVPTLRATMVASTASAVRRDGDDQVGLREPVAAKVAGVNDAGDLLAAGDVLHVYVVGLGLEDEPVHGVALGAGQFADVVGRQGDGVALPLGGEGLAVGGELAANAVGIGNQEGRAEAVAEIAVGVIVHVEHFFGRRPGRARPEHRRCPCRGSWR